MLLSLGEIRWRMLCHARKYKIFRYHDLRIPSRRDVEHFQFLIDQGLIEPAPEGRRTNRPEGAWRKHPGDPQGLFVVTDRGHQVLDDFGMYTPAPVRADKPKAAMPA